MTWSSEYATNRRMNMTQSLPEAAASVAHPLRPEPATEDWMTDRMAYELAAACQMAGIPVRPMGANKPKAEPVPEPEADQQAATELSDVAKGAREFDQLMRVGIYQLVDSVRQKVTAPAELIEGFVRAACGKGGSAQSTLPVAMLVAGPFAAGRRGA